MKRNTRVKTHLHQASIRREKLRLKVAIQPAPPPKSKSSAQGGNG